jgi:hypothetical protein
MGLSRPPRERDFFFLYFLEYRKMAPPYAAAPAIAPIAIPTVLVSTFVDPLTVPLPSSEPVSDVEPEPESLELDPVDDALAAPAEAVPDPPLDPFDSELPGIRGMVGSIKFINDSTLEFSSSL